ncbi:Heptaprenyl diphosphate synthase component I [Alkalibacterium sp. AK22]|uniref:Gx transporter family protein n=1 Tax=Alkalibacterium sp. AK22 TaxID=1229520 RepID=UPI00045067AF|nr:Gx transporter family protein [Alkalibacterium sp. AK22]EXJ23791.1 Heptaprenyl diphosphate synthase component I [Alkalibacterium sp. AK22]
MTRTQKLIYIALLSAQAVILGIAERSIPFPFAFAPGAKLGVANLIIIIAIYTLPFKDSIKVVIMRLLMTTLLGGTLSTLMYSTAGALLSYTGMLLVKFLGGRRISIIGVSATGGILHNLGQLIVASLIAQTWTVLLYLPVLSFMGILSGIAIGIAANFMMEHVSTIQRFKKAHEEKKQLKDRSAPLHTAVSDECSKP